MELELVGVERGTDSLTGREGSIERSPSAEVGVTCVSADSLANRWIGQLSACIEPEVADLERFGARQGSSHAPAGSWAGSGAALTMRGSPNSASPPSPQRECSGRACALPQPGSAQTCQPRSHLPPGGARLHPLML